MGILACIGVISPFPFYYWLWNYPQAWVDLCGRGRDPCRVMALVAHFLKVVQFVSVLSVSTLSWPPPFYFWPLLFIGQFLNFRVFKLLGESGTYYGIRFGKNIPWVTEFPLGTIRDPQYVGSILSLLACFHWTPLGYILLWIIGYLIIMQVEAKEDPSTRAKPIS
ncbi:phosphatidyl-N-methylethanolamine N-methyltransferase [Andrographis paniculata]|uniref:phosphatidyl-N-methylethanolamine N-methyltransferase n=1 Tax=Andrographis paniculata TaxID=175694 RepID=UPI0021E84781|nr:phosphatidyl-N-methylethanolamine N-methyltransferase [Andrographis paniculata]